MHFEPSFTSQLERQYINTNNPFTQFPAKSCFNKCVYSEIYLHIKFGITGQCALKLKIECRIILHTSAYHN